MTGTRTRTRTRIRTRIRTLTRTGARRRAAAAAVLLALVVTTAGPAAAATTTAGRPPAGPVTPVGPVGIWQLDGYGTVLRAESGRLQEYQVTGISCLPGASARRLPGGGSSAAFRYATEDGEVLTVRPGSVRVDGSVGDRATRRLTSLPERCREAQEPGPAADPVATFDVFWQTFAENYPFFAAKGVDWNAVRASHRPRVHAGTTEDELFAVFEEILAPLHDAHVHLSDGADRFFGEVRPGTVMPTLELETRVKAYIQEVALGGRAPQEFAQGRISYADLPDGRGYLRLSGFGGYTGSGDFASESAELDRVLESVFTAERTARLRGLVIDLRINGGGSDELGLRLAARLTDRPYFAYAKRVRNDPADATRFTRPHPLYVQPARGPRYTGPVAVLTGGSTVSAGETFTQALLERPGRTVRIGEPTQGVFSDVLGRSLPNGWELGLPNEQFLTRTGKTFDGPGIPVDVTTPVFTQEEFDAHRDSAFAAALRRLPRA
ncbi:S41 family peptidase [Streptomyces sp. NBC_01264]|uniref:S41 family peptidase n=1 Tax=Streptomyces sp. NBC_01264 TaxID=2903804 RepID=UPI00224F3081|nr:S41 family peptidase [Streptomyces sp. NBC_01264]MCX4782797.1 S41 family peptidase [Streptomyces sp. NBC_01264]